MHRRKRTTKNITLALPDELWARMEKRGEVNWSAVARESIERYVANREGPGLARSEEDEEGLLRDQVGLLARALRSDTAGVRESTVVQLSTFGTRAVPYLKVALTEALKEIGDRSKERRSYEDDYGGRSDPELAATGLCTVLGMVADPRAFPELEASLPRPEAVEALAKLRSDEALGTIVESIPHWYRKSGSYQKKYSVDDSFVRRVFSYFGDRGTKKLHEVLGKGPSETRELVAKIVAILGDKSSLDGLKDTLENGDYAAKAEAARAVQELKAKDAVPTLLAVLFKIREYAPSQPARKTKGRSFGGDDYEDHQSWREACLAIGEALLELGSVDDWLSVAYHWPAIEYVKYDFRGAVQNAGEKAVPGLTRLLQASQPETQRDAAEMIAKIKRGERYDPDKYRV
jgi:HEAT repeat protein